VYKAMWDLPQLSSEITSL